MATGHIVQVQGPVVDLGFQPGELPFINNAVTIQDPTRSIDLTVEVAQHLGNDVVRCIAMSSTDGLVRGMPAEDTGQPISVPVGRETLGRVFNLLGKPVNEKGPINVKEYWAIHRPPPTFSEQSTEQEILETGLKVVDLLTPFLKGGKIGLFGGAGLGKTVLNSGTHHQYRHRTRRLLGLRGRGRTHPRRQQPLAGNDRVRRYRQDRDGLRADERAARCAPARGPLRPDHR